MIKDQYPQDSGQQRAVGKKYHYIHIWASSGEIRVQCTDPHTLRVLIRAVEKIFPSSSIKTRNDLTGKIYVVQISGLEPEDSHQQIAWWLFKMKCDQGWEPMATGDHWYKLKLGNP